MPYVLPVIIIIMVTFYYFVDPLMESFPIKCVWLELTDTQCPACGFQRALHALLRGEFVRALNYNYFFVISVPYAFLAVIATWYNYNHIFDKLNRFVYHRFTLKVYICIYFFWWIFRNVFDV